MPSSVTICTYKTLCCLRHGQLPCRSLGVQRLTAQHLRTLSQCCIQGFSRNVCEDSRFVGVNYAADFVRYLTWLKAFAMRAAEWLDSLRRCISSLPNEMRPQDLHQLHGIRHSKSALHFKPVVLVRSEPKKIAAITTSSYQTIDMLTNGVMRMARKHAQNDLVTVIQTDAQPVSERLIRQNIRRN